MPKVYIIAGPNGAGKTTFAKEFLPHYAKCPNFVNADLIASGLSPLCDSWILFDNASGKPEEIVQKDSGRIKILNKESYGYFTGDR